MKILEVGWEKGIGTGHMGPVTNVIFQLTQTFAGLGYDVTLATGPTQEQRTLLSTDIRVVECPTATPMWENPLARKASRLSLRLERNSQYPYMRELASKVDLESFDVIHTHMPAHAALLQRILRVKCAYTIHTPQAWCDKGLYRGAKGLVREAVKQIKLTTRTHDINVIEEAWLAVALGLFVRDEVRRGNIVVIPNGINLSDWPSADKASARAELGLRKDEFLVVFAASIRPSKGLPVLLRALDSLTNKRVRLKALVLGHVSSELESLVRGLPVELAGFVSNRSHTFRAYLSAADVVVVPSISDNQPTIVLEALAMGTPVIASRVGAIPDMVTHDVGLLFEPGNSAELAELLELFCSEPSRREAMARSCRRRIEQNFTWDACAKAYIAAFEQRKRQNSATKQPFDFQC